MIEDDRVTQLHEACVLGDLKQVNLLCDTSNIETPDKNNYRPIHLACICGHLAVVKYLHEHGCDIEAPGNLGNRPLHLAVTRGRLDVVKYLSSYLCELDIPNDDSQRPIRLACRAGNTEIVDDRVTQLHEACVSGDLEQVTLLCDTSNIETPDKNNYRPIHLAFICGHLAVVEYLHEHGCDIDAPGNLGNRPLHLAVKHGRLDVVKYLCSHQCEIDIPNDDSQKPIHLACRAGNTEIVDNDRQLCEIDTVIKMGGDSELDLFIQKERLNIHKFLFKESFKRQLVEELSNMKVECDEPCDHSSCFQSIYLTKTKIVRGGFGDVFQVKYPKPDCTLCMKSIYLDPSARNQKSKHIESNIKKYLNTLHHERIVQYFGMINSAEEMLIFMEYVEGISLDKHINKKPLPHNKVIQYSKEILEGLKFLYENKIIHRDIKPQNIMLDKEDHVKLCDFGLSLYLESIGQRSQILTADPSSEMTQCGTPNYMAPECVTGQKYSYPVDIWSLGASVVEMLTGVPPFNGMEKWPIIFHIGTIQKIEFIPAEPMSDGMKSLVDPMLCKCPSSRATTENGFTRVPPFHGIGYRAIIFHIDKNQKIEFIPTEPICEDMKSFVEQMLRPCPSSRATAVELLKFINNELHL